MSTVITPFQGTDPFSTATFNNRISQINTGFSYISNPNLLDNWYFGNPVNQRGQTSYTGAGYGIDRWKSYTNLTVIIEPDGITIRNDTDDTGYFGQIEEDGLWNALVGKTVTMSVLTGNGTLYFCTGTYGTHMDFSVGEGVSAYMWPTSKEPFDFSIASGASIKVSAVKIELGSQQTLAHQDADGNWVLNEIPDYGEQLRRCQRYFYKVHYVQYQTINAAFEGPGYSFLALPIPVCMRDDKPTVTQSVPITAGVSTKTFNSVDVKGSMAILGINYALQETYANACYAYCPTADGVTFTLSADL